MQYRVFDTQYQQRLYLHGDVEVQFHNREAVVEEVEAYHMARTMKNDEFILEKKIVPFRPESWTKEKRIIWGANFSTANGFGMVAENTVKELMKLGCDVRTWGGLSGNPLSGAEFVDPLVQTALFKVPLPDCIEIQHQQPPAFKNSVVERKWIYTMFETTHTPNSWIKMLNNIERIIVPSSWLVEAWRAQGVTRPIDVVGHGIDPTHLYYLERPERETFTFLHYGQLSMRKGSDLVARAFVREFKGADDVKLIVKNTFPYFPFALGVKNIEYIHATYSKEKLRALLQRADCFVFPTRGEGFGLPAFEAMATGLPTIVTNWSGPADYADADDTLLLDYSMKPSKEFDLIYEKFYEPGEDSGTWAEPSLEDLQAKMRWAYEHRAEAKAMGKRAAERIAKDWTWEKKIKGLYDIIDSSI